MKRTLFEYKNKILKLPLKNKYEKEDLLIDDFLIEKDGDIEIYYAPHNDYINKSAKIFIVGITPGFQQMNTAMVTARKELETEKDIEKIQYLCKKAGRFSGSLRKNIISMLNELELNKKFNIDDCSELFHKKDYLLHTVSLIPYSVFIKGKNYSGHTPKLINNKTLMKYVKENFIEELNSLEDAEDLLIIPLGRAVEEVLVALSKEKILKKDQILLNFPHPSGANVNRLVQFNNNKEEMLKKIRNFNINLNS